MEKINLVEKFFGENMALIFYMMAFFAFILYKFFGVGLVFFICSVIFGSVLFAIEYAIKLHHEKAVERIKMEK